MSRIRSTDGNVIAVDFRSDTPLTVTLEWEFLYQDDRIILARVTGRLGSKPLSIMHLAADLASGRIHTL